MSSNIDILIRDLADTIRNMQNKKVTPYDTQATVMRIEDNVAWVHIPGGVDETPVQMTANAKVGDTVQVRVSGGQAWLYGNVTAPPTDDTTAKNAKIAAENAKENVEVLDTRVHITEENIIDLDYRVETAEDDIVSANQQIPRVMYMAYATSINGDGFTVDDLYSVVNEPNDEDIETYLEFYLDPNTGEYNFYPTEDEEVVDGKTYYVESSNTHAFRGMCFSSSNIQPTEPNYYTWEINPEWASKYADSYVHEFDGGVAIFNSNLNDNTTYAAITALALSFYLNGNQQLRVGYEESINDYGVISETHIALGSGAGVKFDNYGHSADGSRGRYVWEVRDNGHLSLKLY